MKDASLVQVGHATFQTPRNGDFALYVEQLTGGQAQLTLDEPGRVQRLSERTAKAFPVQARGGRALAAAGPAGPALATDAPSEFAALGQSVRRVLGVIRWSLLLAAVVQVGFLIVLSLGSFIGLGASLLVWWLLGRVMRLMDGVGTRSSSQGSTLAQIRSELQARAAGQSRPERRL